MVITKDLLYELAYLYRTKYIDVVQYFREIVDELNLDSLYKQIWKKNDKGDYITKKPIKETKEYETITGGKFTKNETRIFGNIEKELEKKLKKINRYYPISPYLEDILRNVDDRLILRLSNTDYIYVKGLAEPVYYDRTLNDFILPFNVPKILFEVKGNQRRICRVRLSTIICYYAVEEKRN